jgi:hypothetical protein
VEDLAPIIRSIQIASTLNERVGRLAAPRTYESKEALSFDLAQLRQLYPEVWANLDHARAELGQRGIEVPSYDQLRASPAANAGGVLDVQLQPTARVEKSAAVNVEGVQKALQACDALRAAVPGMTWIDWDNLARKEAAELAQSIGSLGPPRWQGMVGTAIAVLFLVGLVVGGVLLVRG